MYTPFLFSTSEQDLHFVLLRRKETEVFPMHWHDEIEVTFVNEGELVLFINSKQFSVPKGEAVIINSGDCHYGLPSSADTTSIVFSPSLLGGTASSEKLIADVKRRLSVASKTTENWKEEDKAYLFSILSELEGIPDDIFSRELLVRSALFRLVAFITDERHNPLIGETEIVELSKAKERISKVFRFIEEHYQDPISLPDAAAAAGYVPTYFSRVFKNCTGMTFYDYLTVFRVRKAEINLLSSNDSIARIASISGFSSVKTFDRVFKEQTGISPLKFRKRSQSSQTR